MISKDFGQIFNVVIVEEKIFSPYLIRLFVVMLMIWLAFVSLDKDYFIDTG